MFLSFFPFEFSITLCFLYHILFIIYTKLMDRNCYETVAIVCGEFNAITNRKQNIKNINIIIASHLKMRITKNGYSHSITT